jgi:signal transduction histidine kinase
MTEDFAVMSLQLRKLVQELGHEVQEHREAEAKIRTLNNELETRVADRTRELSLSNSALTESLDKLRNTQKELVESEKMAALSHLVVGVAHELNTPIGNCLTTVSYLENLAEGMGETINGGALTRTGLNDFMAQLHEASGLARQNLVKAGKLVGFFKQMAVNMEEEATVILHPAALVEDVLRGLNLRALETGPLVENCIDPGLMVRTRSGALFRVLSNLLDNAVEHAFVGRTPGRVWFEARNHVPWLEIRVIDDGRGIPGADHLRIFEPFYTTGRGYGHVGLGLSIAFNLVTARLGGSIQCQGRPGGGTCFTIRLPALDTETPE